MCEQCTFLQIQSHIIHAALLATVCDIPATAKIGGFVGHASKHACWKCSKIFPYDPSLKRVNFSGVQLGPLRDHDTHKQNALKTLTAATPTQQSELELHNGSRFTQLMYLPYYDCVCMVFNYQSDAQHVPWYDKKNFASTVVGKWLDI